MALLTSEQRLDRLTRPEKPCSDCKEVLSMKNFDRNQRRLDGRQNCCKECMKIRRRTTQKASDLKRKYGLSLQELEQMIIDHNERCAICSIPSSKTRGRWGTGLSIDHNHNTGDVRGLLCSDCNFGLGNFRDNIESLKNAIKYLEKL